MSKKSGFFYALLGMISGLWATPYQLNPSPQYQPSEGRPHRALGGRTITSRGSKPSYYKDKPLYQDRGDIIYVSPGHSYWRTRALAEANR